MIDSRVQQTAALIDDARCLVADLEEEGGHPAHEVELLKDARARLNQALTVVDQLGGS